MKERLDILLVNRGLAASREKARTMIMEGIVYVNGQKEDKPGSQFAEDAVLEARGETLPYVKPEDIGEEISFASIDVSFISLTKVLGPVQALLAQDGQIACLVKPQFEAGREKVGKKGVVRDPAVHEEVLARIASFAAELGFAVLRMDFSPIKGPEGNIEYLLHLKNHGREAGDAFVPSGVEETVKKAHEAL